MVNAAMSELLQAGSVRQVNNLVFVINSMTDRTLDLILDDYKPADGSPVASVTFGNAGAKQRAVLVERAEKPRGRYPYDEDRLHALCRTDVAKRAIVLEGDSTFTPVETMVSMTKALHLAVFPDKASQWLFGRLEAPRWPPAPCGEGLTIALAHAVGTRLTKSRASVGEETLAWVYFALKGRN